MVYSVNNENPPTYGMKIDESTLKSFISERHTETASAHRAGADGIATCLALTETMDSAISSLFSTLEFSETSPLAVFALGGYGRRELSPCSDIDVMILYDPSEQDASAAATAFLHAFWDVGVDIGHSVRTIEESLALYHTSLDSWVSVLESRFLCGNPSLAASLSREIKNKIATQEDHWLIKMIFEDVESRHQRYGNSVKLLEPHIKKSAGGLRDLHTVYWLHRGTDTQSYDKTADRDSALRAFLLQLDHHTTIDKEVCNGAVKALSFLFRVRHEMHYQRKSLHDTLDYALQLDIAEQLGYGPRGDLRSVEVFMRDYYRHARSVYRINHQLAQSFREKIEPSHHSLPKAEQVSDILFIHDQTLSIDPGVTHLEDVGSIMNAFVVMAEREVDPDVRLRGVIERSADVLIQAKNLSPAVLQMFKRILRSRSVAPTLRAMSDTNVLERVLPEFGELVAFFQHSVYHYFTADEHTLIALDRAERLRDEQGILREVFRNLRRREILYLAILLHDIAKPHGVADHEIRGAEMATNILRRLQMEDAIDDVVFLIRNHLLMEQVAFRRNVHDLETIKEFSSQFSRPEQLDYLYLLTYADLSSVNMTVWTEWKASLLQELYQRSSEVLRRNLKGSELDEFHQTRREQAREKVVNQLSDTLSRIDVEEHLAAMQNEDYISSFTEKEIEEHIRRGKTTTVSTLFSHVEGYTEVTILTGDAPFTLARMCAVLAANDANIFDATIFTRDDGLIIDRFRVTNASSHNALEQRVYDKIRQDMQAIFEGRLDIEHLFEAHSRRWKRRPKMPPNPSTRIAVEFEDAPRYTIIDVYAPDSVGLLYKITEAISKLHLDIHFAKIATRVDGIVDAFYVRWADGSFAVDEQRRKAIRRSILERVRSLQEQELGKEHE